MLDRAIRSLAGTLALAFVVSACSSLTKDDAQETVVEPYAEPAPSGEVVEVPPEQPLLGPTESFVHGTVTFSGAPGGVTFDVIAYDESVTAIHTGEVTIEVWEGYRDTSGTDPLPDALSPPTGTPRIVSRPLYDIRSADTWDTNELTLVDPEYTADHDQYWIFVRLTYQRKPSSPGPTDTYHYRKEWTDGVSTGYVGFQKL